jgi:hypothetical protein
MEEDAPVTVFAQPPIPIPQPSYVDQNVRPAETPVPVFGRNLSDAFQAVRKYYQKNASERLQLKKLRPRYYFTEPKLQGQLGASKVVPGDSLLQRIRYYLANMPVERSDDQKRFHEEFLRAVAPGMFRKSSLRLTFHFIFRFIWPHV